MKDYHCPRCQADAEFSKNNKTVSAELYEHFKDDTEIKNCLNKLKEGSVAQLDQRNRLLTDGL